MEDEVYNKLLVVYKDLKDHFEEVGKLNVLTEQRIPPICMEVFYKMLLKEMNRRKK